MTTAISKPLTLVTEQVSPNGEGVGRDFDSMSDDELANLGRNIDD
jgi:hypothetical protein